MKLRIRNIMWWILIVAIGCTSPRAALCTGLIVTILFTVYIADRFNLIPPENQR